MESREKLLKRLDDAQKASIEKLQGKLSLDPSAIMLQQGANAPIVATAVTIIAEVLIDIRDTFSSILGVVQLAYVNNPQPALVSDAELAAHNDYDEERGVAIERDIDQALKREKAPQCPECKSLRVAINTRPDKKDEETLDYKFSYVCENCKHEWEA